VAVLKAARARVLVPMPGAAIVDELNVPVMVPFTGNPESDIVTGALNDPIGLMVVNETVPPA